MASISEEVLPKVAEGNFKCALKILDGKILTQEVSVKIIVACCRVVCTQGQQIVTNLQCLCDLLRICNKFINDLAEPLCKPCLQSLYHITAFLLEKGNLQYIIELEELLIPAFINILEHGSLTEIYNSLSMLLYKYINKVESSISEEILIKVFLMSIKMFQKCTNIVKLLSVASAYFQNEHFLKANAELQCLCYSYILTSLNPSNDISVNDSYNVTLETLQHIVINLLRRQEFEKAKTYLEMGFTTILNMFNNQEFVQIKDLIKTCFELISNPKKLVTDIAEDCIQKIFVTLKKISTNRKCSPLLHTTCHFVYGMLQEFLEHVKALDSRTKSLISDQVFLELFKFLDLNAHILAITKSNHRKCPNCKVKTDLLTSINIHSLMACFVKIAFDEQATLSHVTLNYVVKSMSACCTKVTELKNLNCEQWKSAWKQIRAIIFNSVVKLYTHNNSKCIPFGALLIGTALKLENQLKIEPEVICKTLHCLSQAFYIENKHEMAAVFAALQFFFCDNVENMSFSQWIQIKFHSSDELKKLTVLCVLTQKIGIVQTYFPSFDLEISQDRKMKILTRELSEYKKKWPSRIPMGAVLSKLLEQGDHLMVAKIVIHTWSNEPSENEEVVKSIPVLIESMLREKTTVETNICLALLYIMQYYIEVDKLQVIIEENMNAVTLPKSDVTDTAKDTNDEISIISFPNLNIDQYLKISSHLVSSLNILTNFLSNPNISYIEDYEMCAAFEKVAYEFEKHGDSIQALQAWCSCWRLSKLTNNRLFMLKYGSFVLKHSNGNSDHTKNLVTECEKHAVFLSTENDLSIKEVLCQYYINKCIMFLHHDAINDSLNEYNQALQFSIGLSEQDKSEIIKLQLDFLNTQFMQLPCDTGIKHHDNYSLGKLFFVLKSITNYIKSHRGARAMVLLLDVYEYLVTMYKWMHFSREMRCYSRCILTFTLKNCLPIRAANMMAHLIHADIISQRFDAARVELSYLVNMLGFKKTGTNYLPKTCTELTELVERFSNMMLTYSRTNNEGSPALVTKAVLLPEFVAHKSNCCCYYCISIEYKRLVLVYFTLEAHLHTYKFHNTFEDECFEVALKYKQYIDLTQSYFEMKVTNIFDSYFIMDLKNSFLQPYGSLLLLYGNELIRTDNVEKAKLINLDLMACVTPLKCRNAYLYNEAILQAIVILLSSTKQNKYEDQKTLLTIPESKSGEFKTPERTKVVFNASYSIKTNAPHGRRIPQVKFNLSPAKTPTEKKPKTFVSQLKTPIKCELRDNEEPEEVAVQIVQSKNMDSVYKLKRDALNEIVNVDISKSEDIIPSSPNAYTPRSLKVESALKARTRLLSKKVQQSSVKLKMDIENNCKVTVCKNLMKELDDTCLSKANLKKKSTTNGTVCKVTRSRNVKK